MGVTFHAMEVGRSTIGVSFDTAAALLGTLGYQDKVAELKLEGSGVLDPLDLLPRIAQARADSRATNMLDSLCLMAWKEPIFTPNCSRWPT